MRNTYLFLMLFIAGMFTACVGPQGEPGMPGRDGKDGPTIKNIVVNVNKEHWQYTNNNNNNCFFATVDMPEITENVFDYGIVKVYRLYDFDSSNATQIELPYVRHKEEQNTAGDWIFYTETVDYDYGIGKMTIYYTESDFNYELDQTFIPEAMQFRCSILYNK